LPIGARLDLFAARGLVGLAVSTTVVAVLVEWGPLPAKAASVATTFAWNYPFAMASRFAIS